MDRGIEPLCQDWESCILTIRWIHQVKLQPSMICLFVRTSAEAGGFEPPVPLQVRQFSKLLVSATHPNFLTGTAETTHSWIAMQRYCYFFTLPNFSLIFFVKIQSSIEMWAKQGPNKRIFIVFWKKNWDRNYHNYYNSNYACPLEGRGGSAYPPVGSVDDILTCYILSKELLSRLLNSSNNFRVE